MLSPKNACGFDVNLDVCIHISRRRRRGHIRWRAVVKLQGGGTGIPPVIMNLILHVWSAYESLWLLDVQLAYV